RDNRAHTIGTLSSGIARENRIEQHHPAAGEAAAASERPLVVSNRAVEDRQGTKVVDTAAGSTKSRTYTVVSDGAVEDRQGTTIEETPAGQYSIVVNDGAVNDVHRATRVEVVEATAPCPHSIVPERAMEEGDSAARTVEDAPSPEGCEVVRHCALDEDEPAAV